MFSSHQLRITAGHCDHPRSEFLSLSGVSFSQCAVTYWAAAEAGYDTIHSLGGALILSNSTSTKHRLHWMPSVCLAEAYSVTGESWGKSRCRQSGMVVNWCKETLGEVPMTWAERLLLKSMSAGGGITVFFYKEEWVGGMWGDAVTEEERRPSRRPWMRDWSRGGGLQLVSSSLVCCYTKLSQSS